MSEENVKVKDLATELGVQPKEMLATLRRLGITAKSQQSSLSAQDAARVRADHTAATAAGQPARPTRDVIVRRRRPQKTEDASPAPAAAATEGEEAAAAVQEPEVAAAAESEKSVPAERAPEAAAPRVKTPKAVPGARVISRPDDVIKPAPAAEEAMPQEVAGDREEESTPQKADVPAKAEAGEKTAQASPRAPSAASRHLGTPDATAAPDAEDIAASRAAAEAASAAAGQGGESEAKKRREEKAAPQVRIISRPAATAAPVRRPAPSAGSGAPGRGQGAPAPGARGGERSFASGQPGRGFELQQERDGRKKSSRPKGGRRTVDFQQEFIGEDEAETAYHGNEGGEVSWEAPRSQAGRRQKRRRPEAKTPSVVTQPRSAAKRKVRMEEFIRVADLAHQMDIKGAEVVKVLFGLGVMSTINQSLDLDTATLVAAEFGYEVERVGFSETDYLAETAVDAPESLKPRSPVVTIMGHVDHGKTSLLDAIRQSSVATGEAGGITQHIGAYLVGTKRGDIVFLDTPGHEAFTAMRARGAQVTDIVILVVAADDGVMDQTREAIDHARAAGVPIMVAVNKIDKPEADPERIIRELSEYGLVAEEWGGDTIFAKVSAKKRIGLDELLELIALEAEVLELKANPDKPARGHIVEAKLDKGRGPVGTVLIQEGTLRQGDTFVCGTFSGRVRAMFNDQGKKVREAGPSTPVEVQGFEGVPVAGEEFVVVADERVARRIADTRAMKQREKELARETRVTLETFLARGADAQEAQTLSLVVKADVQGSLEAILEAVKKLSTDQVRIDIVHGGTGAISESDIMLAAASNAIVIGFNVRPTAKVKEVAESENVDIRFYNIIYNLVDEIRNAMAGLLAPVEKEEYLGQAEVRQVFTVPKVGAIAGSYVVDGKITRNAGVRLLRDSVVIYTGKIASLKRFKDDAREVLKGYECGIGLLNYNDVKPGDVIEAFEVVEEKATL